MNAINFTARHIDDTTIQQRNVFFKYKNKNASIVELDKENSKDLNALKSASQGWMRKGGKFADAISYLAESKSDYPEYKSHFLALTTQNSDFKELNPKNILGLMLFYEKPGKSNEVEVLEVNPSTNKSKNFIRKYKQVGRKLVEFVQENFCEKDIILYSDYKARDFYKKLGFIQKSSDVCDLCWKAVK